MKCSTMVTYLRMDWQDPRRNWQKVSSSAKISKYVVRPIPNHGDSHVSMICDWPCFHWAHCVADQHGLCNRLFALHQKALVNRGS